MKEDNKGGAGASLGFTGALQIAFIVLKLCHKIEWSWLWVLAPTWISTGIVLLIFGIIIIIALFKN